MMGDILPKSGSIVSSTIDWFIIKKGDLGVVVQQDASRDRVRVDFAGTEANLRSSQIIEKEHYLRANHFVCFSVSTTTSTHGESSIKEGDIGQIVGTSRDRMVIDFGQGDIEHMMEHQIREPPSVWAGPVGSIVFSLLDHAGIKKGDRGTIIGSSTDRGARDRVAVKFGRLGPRTFNMHADMVTVKVPLTPTLFTEDVLLSSQGHHVRVDFASIETNLRSSQTTKEKNYSRVNHFVCCAVAATHGKLSIKEGDIGKVVGTTHSQLMIDFGQGDIEHMMEHQIREPPSVWAGPVGSCIYSLIDHAHIKKGDRGTIIGPSTDRGARDRVAVKFGRLDPRHFNMHADMVTVEAPPAPTLCTEDVSLISHTHGRMRRAERNILRRELQAAIKYGVKETANPGRDGSTRWRYTHEGVVYITDETSRHEVTSWRIDGENEAVAPAEIKLAGKGCHAVLIVDSSGSMGGNDVPGFKSRHHAVYDCLVRDFVKEQVENGAADDVVVTLISMSEKASVLIETHPLDHSLIARLKKISKRRPCSHGNYLPALDRALEVMTDDAPNRGSLLLLFFSDGAPSDHYAMKCEHGICVFEESKEDLLILHPRKSSVRACQHHLRDKVKQGCLDRIKHIGQVFGRDKVVLRTLAFGPPKENFRLLDELAGALPRGEFQKLGLDASKLKTAMSSLSSSMTELRTEGGGCLLTPRLDKVVDTQQDIDTSSDIIRQSDGWWIYSHRDFLGKYEFHSNSGKLEKVELSEKASGLAFISQPFAEGAERLVYRCTEIRIPDVLARGSLKFRALRHGLRLVAKEAKTVENLIQGRSFHERFARIQHDAADLSVQFNQKLPIPQPQWKVSFIPTHIYGCYEPSYKDQTAWVLVEPELDGKFTKWNNNAGAVRGSALIKTEETNTQSLDNGIASPLGIGMPLLEEEEESSNPISVDDIPQAFSHFTYEQSVGRQLVCDLQGVWNSEDGFVLTDPVIHHVSRAGRRHKNGATDKGLEGVKKFFATHKCNGLCERMGLSPRSPDDLMLISSEKET